MARLRFLQTPASQYGTFMFVVCALCAMACSVSPDKLFLLVNETYCCMVMIMLHCSWKSLLSCDIYEGADHSLWSRPLVTSRKVFLFAYTTSCIRSLFRTPRGPHPYKYAYIRLTLSP